MQRPSLARPRPRPELASCVSSVGRFPWPKGSPLAKVPRVFGGLVSRLLNGLVLALALLAFFTYRVGDKTLAQHTRAVFTTPAAKETGRALTRAARGWVSGLEQGLGVSRPAPPAASSERADEP